MENKRNLARGVNGGYTPLHTNGKLEKLSQGGAYIPLHTNGKLEKL